MLHYENIDTTLLTHLWTTELHTIYAKYRFEYVYVYVYVSNFNTGALVI